MAGHLRAVPGPRNLVNGHSLFWRRNHGPLRRYRSPTSTPIIEPADLWTRRVSPKWGDLVPHVRFHERRQEDYWYIGDHKLYGVGAFAQARWHEFPPSHPKRLAEAFLPAVDAGARLAYNDEVGVH